jgi:putative ABC transport system ATP-binding protein
VAAEAPLLTLRGVGKQLPGSGHPLLTALDLTLAAGEIVAIVGPSGSGKSSLLNLIAGLDPIENGSIRLGDSELTRLDESGRTALRRQRIGFVFQFFNLIPTLTARENCLLPQELNGQRQPERVDALLAAVGLTARAHHFPDALSGGEQQRVALVRALAHRPALVLADEPTGNLDEATAATVADLLFATLRQERCTALIVTHSRQLAARADRVLRLHGGRLEPLPAATGTAAWD